MRCYTSTQQTRRRSQNITSESILPEKQNAKISSCTRSHGSQCHGCQHETVLIIPSAKAASPLIFSSAHITSLLHFSWLMTVRCRSCVRQVRRWTLGTCQESVDIIKRSPVQFVLVGNSCGFFVSACSYCKSEQIKIAFIALLGLMQKTHFYVSVPTANRSSINRKRRNTG